MLDVSSKFSTPQLPELTTMTVLLGTTESGIPTIKAHILQRRWERIRIVPGGHRGIVVL